MGYQALPVTTEPIKKSKITKQKVSHYRLVLSLLFCYIPGNMNAKRTHKQPEATDEADEHFKSKNKAHPVELDR